jgi:hypothetical protein
MVGFELVLYRAAEDEIQQKFEFALQSGIGGWKWSLALERGDCVCYEIFNLRKFAKHYYYYKSQYQWAELTHKQLLAVLFSIN